MKNIFLTLTALIIVVHVNSQEFTIKKLELTGDKVNIYYDLVDSVKSRTYTVDLYSSRDNYVSKLEKLAGDQGLEVKPGGNHKIVWAAKDELGADFEGKVGLEVRGRLYIPFVRLEGLNSSYKRGKAFPVTWTGGTQQNILNFDLYKGDQKIEPFSNIANVGHAEINIPQRVKPGKDYYFKITDSKNKDQIVNTGTFAVKRKVPLLLKVIPIVAAGVVVATLPKSSSTKNIPDPLDPSTIH